MEKIKLSFEKKQSTLTKELKNQQFHDTAKNNRKNTENFHNILPNNFIFLKKTAQFPKLTFREYKYVSMQCFIP